LEVIKFILKKLIYGVLVLFGAVTLVFLIFNLRPGDPARMLGGQRADAEVIESIRQDLGLDLPLYQQYFLYLNDLSPISIHNPTVESSHVYLDTAKYKGVELINFTDNRSLMIKKPYLRRSYRSKKEVSAIISESMPGTFWLALTAIVFATLLGIILGVITALKKGTFIDEFLLVVSVLGMSAPSFYMAMIISLLFGFYWADIISLPLVPLLFLFGGILVGIIFNKRNRKLGFERKFSFTYMTSITLMSFSIGMGYWILSLIINSASGSDFMPGTTWTLDMSGTGLEMTGALYEYPDSGGEKELRLQNLILPALTLGIRPLAIIVQLTRSSLLEVLSLDYVRTAKAKGLSYYKVVIRHALRNALNPVVTAISGWFASLLAGAVFVERIFNWKGLGEQILDSLLYDDFPILIGCSLLICAIFVVLNVFVDILYGVLDPRVRITA